MREAAGALVARLGDGRTLELDSAGAEPVATLDIYRAGEGLLTRRRFTWAEINGQQKFPLLPPPPYVE